jgi:hypothetical protein
MRAVITCEESQVVTIALRELGHEAYSCDLLECSGGFPEWHIKGDAREVIKLGWDFAGLHSPCTYTAICGNRHYYNSPKRVEGANLTKELWELIKNNCTHGYLEQPKTIMQRFIGKKSQVIHPYQFGHGETKETWLWLHNLPFLFPTNEVSGRENRIWKMAPSAERSKLRSKTYPGIAQAMADQWSAYILSKKKVA